MSKQAPPDLLVRPMVPADLPEMLDVWVAAWQVAYPKIDFEARRGWAVEHIAGLEQEGALSFVALGEGRILGAVVVDPNTGYLDQIVVAPEFWGSNVATLLLDAGKRISPARLDLLVNKDNARAITFYEKHGFVMAGDDVNPVSGRAVFRMRWRP